MVTLTLRPPTVDDEPACRFLHKQMTAEGFPFLLTQGSWQQILDKVTADTRGIDLPPWQVRSDWLLADVDGLVVGCASIRYELNEFLRNVGGHVGYAVAPNYRRRGYATAILNEAIKRLNSAGVERVLVTCEVDNVASYRTIEKCGES